MGDLMHKTSIGSLAALSVIVVLSGCSDFTASGDPLSDAEASALAAAIVGQGFPGLGGIGAAPAPGMPGAAAAAAEKVTINLNDSGPCQGGGTVALVGQLTADVNQESRTGSLEYDFTLTPAGCVVTAEGGATFTLTGDPNVRGEGKLDWSTTSFSGSLKYSGKFLWQSAGRSGACGVDLEASLNLTSGTSSSASASLSGSVCGVSVNRSVVIET